MIAVPDLQKVAEAVAADRILEPLYMSEVGPISALDVIFGFGKSLAAGNMFMAHRTGFTPTVLGSVLFAAGFDPVRIRRLPDDFELVALAHRPPVQAADTSPR